MHGSLISLVLLLSCAAAVFAGSIDNMLVPTALISPSITRVGFALATATVRYAVIDGVASLEMITNSSIGFTHDIYFFDGVRSSLYENLEIEQPRSARGGDFPLPLRTDMIHYIPREPGCSMFRNGATCEPFTKTGTNVTVTTRLGQSWQTDRYERNCTNIQDGTTAEYYRFYIDSSGLLRQLVLPSSFLGGDQTFTYDSHLAGGQLIRPPPPCEAVRDGLVASVPLKVSSTFYNTQTFGCPLDCNAQKIFTAGPKCTLPSPLVSCDTATGYYKANGNIALSVLSTVDCPLFVNGSLLVPVGSTSNLKFSPCGYIKVNGTVVLGNSLTFNASTTSSLAGLTMAVDQVTTAIISTGPSTCDFKNVTLSGGEAGCSACPVFNDVTNSIGFKYVCNGTACPTYSARPCPSPSPTPTPIPTPSPTPSPSTKPSASPSPTPTPTPSVSTSTPTPASTSTPSPSSTPSSTATPSPSSTPSSTATPTATPTPSPTEIPTPSPTEIPTPSPTEIPTPTPTPVSSGSSLALCSGLVAALATFVLHL